MLSDAKIRAAKPSQKPTNWPILTSYLYVSAAGGKLWHMNYMFDGKQRTLSIGPYPLISLADARAQRDEAKRKPLDGKDPGIAKRVEAAGRLMEVRTTFEQIARERHELNKSRWAKVHAQDVIESLERDAFPALGRLPITCIDAPTVLQVLRKVEERPAIETAGRVRQRISAVFVYAIASGRAKGDPAGPISWPGMPQACSWLGVLTGAPAVAACSDGASQPPPSARKEATAARAAAALA